MKAAYLAATCMFTAFIIRGAIQKDYFLMPIQIGLAVYYGCKFVEELNIIP